MSDTDLNFGDSMDETLIGNKIDNVLTDNFENTGFVAGVGLESCVDIRVTEYEKIEGKGFGETADETLIGDDDNSNLSKKVEKTGDVVADGLKSFADVVADGLKSFADVEVTDIREYEKIEGDDNISDLSKKLEKTEDAVGDGLESKTEVRVTNTYGENESIEVGELGAATDENLIEDNNDNNNDGVVLESNKDNNGKDDIRFGVSDLVWGKVRSHPWWPGQVFDPVYASAKANKYSKKDGFLITYFGDQTFAWNEAMKIKPFREHFVSMENQSKTDSFRHAVDCALEEVSRRVELGLACKCLSNEVFDKIKTQSLVNAGIRKESSKREGGNVNGDFSGKNFEPLDLVRYVEGLAKSPCGGTDRLGFVTAQAQLLAFNRHKGFSNLPEFQMFGGFLGNGLKEMGIKDGSKKRKKISRDFVSPSKKEREMSESQTSMSVKKGKGKAETCVIDSMMVEEKKDSSLSVTQKHFTDVGRRICSVIPALKDGGNGSIFSSVKKRGRKKAIKAEEVSSDEILSHLCAVARGPIKGYSSLGSIISFLSDMRNMFSLEKSEKGKASEITEKEMTSELTKKEMTSEITEKEKTSEITEKEELSKEETMADTVVQGFEDSYWTDRVVVSDTQEQVLFEPDTLNENAINPETLNGNAINGVTCAESEPKEETGANVKEKCDEECNPTALILNFSDIESVPSQQNLNNIFRRYGPLNETGTEVLKKSKRAKVIFKRRSDAETAFSSSGKFSIFGPSLVSYRLHYLPNKPDQVSPAKKRSKKGAKSVEDNEG